MNSKTYDLLKQVSLVWLPAIATLYFALAGIWGLPDAEKVVGSITAIDTFLGVLVHISSQLHNPTPDGNIVVDPEKGSLSLEFNSDPETMTTLEKGKTVTFQVVPKSQ